MSSDETKVRAPRFEPSLFSDHHAGKRQGSLQKRVKNPARRFRAGFGMVNGYKSQKLLCQVAVESFQFIV